jgi:hypothetical protein
MLCGVKLSQQNSAAKGSTMPCAPGEKPSDGGKPNSSSQEAKPIRPTPAVNDPGFIKLQRSSITEELFADPMALHLLTVIAYRARFSDEPNLHNLRFGEAFIGDHDNYGMTRQQERSARERLSRWSLAKFETSNHGTVATLLDSRIYSLRDERKSPKNGQQTNQQFIEASPREPTSRPTTGQPAANQQATTNSEGQKDQNDLFSSRESEVGKAGKASAADPRRHAITSQWGQRYRKAFGFDYALSGCDAAALKRLLQGIEDSSETFLSVAEDAWKRAKDDRFATACKKAASIHGLCGAYNDVRVELKRPFQSNGTNGTHAQAPTPARMPQNLRPDRDHEPVSRHGTPL